MERNPLFMDPGSQIQGISNLNSEGYNELFRNYDDFTYYDNDDHHLTKDGENWDYPADSWDYFRE